METEPEKHVYNKDSLVGDSEKKKALAITWDDELESDEDESDNEDQGEEGHKQFLAFMAASKTEGRTGYLKSPGEKIVFHVS
ncbi:hypothetical protein CsSME_00039681 [Camellia sinensis var. sinensis]